MDLINSRMEVRGERFSKRKDKSVETIPEEKKGLKSEQNPKGQY